MTHAQIQDIRSGGRSWTRLVGTAAVAATLAASAVIGTAPGAAAASTSDLRASIVKLTNAERAAKDCKPLKRSERLTKAAQRHAQDMAARNYFSHTSLDGRSWDRRIRIAGWTKPGGENIAYGFDSSKSVVRAWMNSPGHRRNIMDCKFKYIGVGYTANGGYWVQDFGY